MRKIFVFLLLFSVLTSCKDNSKQYYDQAQEFYSKKDYYNAELILYKIKTKDEYYSKSKDLKSKIQHTQLTIKIKEDSEKETIKLKEYEKAFLTLTEKTKYSNISQIKSDLNQIDKFIKYYNKSKTDTSIVNKTIKNNIFKISKKNFPTFFPNIRKQYASLTSELLWEENIKVKIKGNKTIEFIAGKYASNKNIKNDIDLLYPILEQLRFTKVNFKWYEDVDEYTSYSINSKKDSDT